MVFAAALCLAGPVSFVAVDGLLIGKYADKKWSMVEGSDTYKGVIKLTSVEFDRLGKTFSGKGIGPNGQGDNFVDMEPFQPGIIVHGLSPKFPRKAVAIGKKNPTYLAVVQEAIKKGGSTGKANIEAAYSVDLDGDGTKEILLEARTPGITLRDTYNGTIKNYTCVLLRCIKNGKPVTEVLEFSASKQGPTSFSYIRSIVDLDSDGRMEIVIGSDYYEGYGSAIFGYQKGVLKKIAENSAGA